MQRYSFFWFLSLHWTSRFISNMSYTSFTVYSKQVLRYASSSLGYENFILEKWYFLDFINALKMSIFCIFRLDIDECAESNECHPNATCTDTKGSYTCECDTGFNGDGFNCIVNSTGIKYPLIFYFYHATSWMCAHSGHIYLINNPLTWTKVNDFKISFCSTLVQLILYSFWIYYS